MRMTTPVGYAASAKKGRMKYFRASMKATKLPVTRASNKGIPVTWVMGCASITSMLD